MIRDDFRLFFCIFAIKYCIIDNSKRNGYGDTK